MREHMHVSMCVIVCDGEGERNGRGEREEEK